MSIVKGYQRGFEVYLRMNNNFEKNSDRTNVLLVDLDKS